MDILAISKILADYTAVITAVFAVLFLILFAICINLHLKLNYMKKRYRKMMSDGDGESIERMIMGHINEVHEIAAINDQIRADNENIKALLQTALTRVAVVRFRAFDDMGSDLSYAVAMLDSNNNGVILSSIFGRDDSRSYAKPVQEGKSPYTLTSEEQQALNEAMKQGF